ncbi:hypothetical protein MUO14_17050 [Halobacillus shinanisalinarum]|uniref:Lipoprotein n=1 Tax=Halobacillus shinanisalinarum TaxID=2932258 RepID=A0ABY4GVI4_9BACI|nr:hypothetical protein [Halobacillus shinanisalinarum]UOQ92185.1 hypothetical protein MUO14_17050 [Halobacillus shinanisalinarum]
MKKIATIFLTLSLCVVLFGCESTLKSQGKEQTEEKTFVDKKQIEQKIIIADSVDDPLPPEAKNVQTMPGKNEPQQLPNVDLSKPIVITEMPTIEDKISDVNE